MNYQFRGWKIELQSEQNLSVVIDKNEENCIIFDGDKDLFAWISLSPFGEGFAFEKMSWSSSYHVLSEEKKIIVKDTSNPEE